MNKILPLVSVVITTKNEEKNIQNCLISIQEQTYKNIETIVVDNNSSDRTKKISKKYTKNVYNKGPERSAQRNFGMINKSKGQYVMFVDADMMLAPYLIESCVECMQSNEYLALHIPEVILGTSYFSKVRRFERTFYDGTVIDGARFFDKEEFKEVGGFDENMSGPEDWDIDKKIKKNGDIGLINSSNNNLSSWKLNNYIADRGVMADKFSNGIFHNESDFVLKEYLGKKLYYSNSFNTYIKKWGYGDSDIKKQFGLWYRYFFVFIENSKYKKLLVHPLLTLGMYYLRILTGVVYMLKNLYKAKSNI